MFPPYIEVMTSRVIPVPEFVLVVFGATGDLARRKLLPAMFHRDIAGQLPAGARVVGVSRGALTDAQFKDQAAAAITAHVDKAEVSAAALARFLERLSYVQAEADTDTGWPALSSALEGQAERVMVYYLATGPALFGPICERLGRYGLNGPNARVVVEKPIGRDLASATALNAAIGEVFTGSTIIWARRRCRI
jgi:glucose-6-phosphate 1-dehydrogenase